MLTFPNALWPLQIARHMDTGPQTQPAPCICQTAGIILKKFHCEGTVPVENGKTNSSCSTGNGQIMTDVYNENSNVTLFDVLRVPKVMKNLIPVSQMSRNNRRIVVQTAGGDSRRGILTMENKDSHQVMMVAMKQMRCSIEPL